MGQAAGNPPHDPQKPARAALVGECPVLKVKVDNIEIECLADTGSQVTLFNESLCKELFCEKPVGSKSDVPWLLLRGANGLAIPYTGYVVADFRVGGIDIPARGIVVVKDECLKNGRALLGMNVLSALWDKVSDQNGCNSSFPSHPLGKEWNTILADCQRIQKTSSSSDQTGTARVSCRYAVTVPAQSEALLWAKVSHTVTTPNEMVLVEPYGDLDVEVGRVLTTIQRGRVPVRVRNLHPHPVTLYKWKKLATITTIDSQHIVENQDVAIVEASPGVIEVNVVQTGSDLSCESSNTLEGGLSQHASLQGDALNEDQQRQLQQLLTKWQHVFSAHDEDYGCTDVVTHQIPTGTAAPIRERYRTIPPSLYQEVRGLLKGMLDAGVIRESCSPWAAPIVLVQKKGSGAWRFCVDYRKLNQVTTKDAFPLPRIEDSLTSLSQAHFYSTLDLAGAYWQVKMAEQDRAKTAFTTPFGLFEWERMPFGLCNAPATFQRLMQRCMGQQLASSALVYLDDVILYSVDFDSHLKHLEAAFQSLQQYGLKLRPEKCHLFRREVKFLGHVVSGAGIAPDPDKVAAVQGWEAPTTVRQVRAFLGFVGYYRRFVKDFSKVAKPLNELLRGTGQPRRRGSPPITWSPQCETAFQQLKAEMLKAPILAYADFTQPFTVYCDASNIGLGAVLSQKQGDGSERVIAYASRSLHPTERNDANYSSFKLELLAMKWAIVEKFKDYLWGAKIIVVTDNSPLVHLNTAKLGAVEQRWVAQLANFDYQIKHRPGRNHTNADALSRGRLHRSWI